MTSRNQDFAKNQSLMISDRGKIRRDSAFRMDSSKVTHEFEVKNCNYNFSLIKLGPDIEIMNDLDRMRTRSSVKKREKVISFCPFFSCFVLCLFFVGQQKKKKYLC